MEETSTISRTTKGAHILAALSRNRRHSVRLCVYTAPHRQFDEKE